MPALPNLTWSQSSFIGATLILCQNHDDVYACTLGLATTLGGNGMDSTLKYMMSGAHGLMWPCLVVPGARATASQSPRPIMLIRCWGQAFVSDRRLPQATPVSWEPKFVTLAHNMKEAPPCFAGSQRRRRLPHEGLGERARKKISRSQRRRMRVEGVMPAMFQRLPHVSTSLGASKAVS
jgi:hypothetical protein